MVHGQERIPPSERRRAQGGHRRAARRDHGRDIGRGRGVNSFCYEIQVIPNLKLLFCSVLS